MQRLIDGYRHFHTTRWPEHRERFEVLASEGQAPQTMVIGCCDSRVDPQMIFGAGPGELFVARNVANLVPPYTPNADHHGTSAAIEFAVRGLEVERLVVLGHGRCGGVGSLLGPQPTQLDDFISSWMVMAAPACLRALAQAEGKDKAALQKLCEHEVVKVSLTNLMTFPWIRQRVEAGRLELQGCWFDVSTGELMRLMPDGAFATVATGPETASG
jgi:carbonic anhydrase